MISLDQKLKMPKTCAKQFYKKIKVVLGFNIQLNLEALLTLHVENQHAVTHFKRDTFSLYEYDLIFGSSVEEAVKRVSNGLQHTTLTRHRIISFHRLVR